MATYRQFQSNRSNAQASTGPKTGEGKARSAQNALRHGLASGQLIIDGESTEDFDALLADLIAEHKPATTTEEILVAKMAQHHWLAQRALTLQARALDDILPLTEATKSLVIFMRYQTTNERAFRQALDDLRKLQKERKKSEIGFVSQNVLPSQPGKQPPEPKRIPLRAETSPSAETSPPAKTLRRFSTR